MNLTLKQKKFTELYALSGNANQAALESGYSKKTAKAIGSENLTKPDIVKYLKSLTKPESDKRISSIKERNEMLTKIMRNVEKDKNISTADRLRAMYLLNRASGVYTQKRELTGRDDRSIETMSVINFVPVGGG